MNSKRYRLILIGVFGLCAIAFIATCYMGLSLLEKKSSSMVNLKLKNKTAEAQLSNLESSKADIAKYAYFKSVANSVIPNDKDQVQAVVEIEQIAQAAGIGIQSITFPSSNLGVTSTSAAGTSAATGSLGGAISQAVPVSGIPGLYSLQLTINPLNGQDVPPAQQVTYAKMLDFLNRIENNRRTAQISQVNIQPGTGNLPLNFNLVLNIFIKPVKL